LYEFLDKGLAIEGKTDLRDDALIISDEQGDWYQAALVIEASGISQWDFDNAISVNNNRWGHVATRTHKEQLLCSWKPNQ